MTPMKVQSLVLLLKLCVIALMLQTQLQAQSGYFHTRGKEIVDGNGKAFLIRGMNLGNWLVPEGYMFGFKDVNSPRLIDQTLDELIGPSETKKFWEQYAATYITEADIHFIKSIGANSIRVPFNYRLFTKENYLGENNEQHGFKLLDSLISWCRKEKLYVILDMHCAPGGQTGDNIDDGYGYPFLFESKEDQELTVSIWKRIADYYKSEPIIIGYDLLNEPIATYFNKEHFNPDLEPLYKRIVTAIRKVDTHHILILGGAQWDSNFSPFGPPFDKNLVYTFHKYWTSPTEKVIRDYIAFRDKYHVPVYCGETGENSNEWIDSFRTTLEQANIGWHFWPYKKINSTRSVVQFKKPENYDTLIHYAETAKKSFADVRKLRPQNLSQVSKALDVFLKNCRFENCISNAGYIHALGFDSAAKEVKYTSRN
jgi:endoglucanase